MKKMNNRVIVSIVIALVLVVAIIASAAYIITDEKEERKTVILVIEEEAIGDGSYNDLVFKGIKSASAEANVSYIAGSESMKDKLDKATSQTPDIIWTVPSKTNKEVIDSAKANPDILYVMVDFQSEEKLDNLITISFNSNESSFLGGCAAAMLTETNVVGFVGGQESEVIEAFEYGYKAGVDYASKILGKNVETISQYADSFTDKDKGRTIAQELYEGGCDVIFQAAGVTGIGVIEEAKVYDKWVIGSDSDQEYLAPDNVLTSVIKEITKATALVNEQLVNDEKLAVQNVVFDFSNGAEGIVQGNLTDNQYKDIMQIKEKILSGDINVPDDKLSYEKFIQNFVQL
ncbi:hypothetical protein A3206_02790 [Candidatus Methanomassiliicoccus intestinalis]|uniref:Basic membrane lipoprotein n=2 Tax=Candidatus Methanomassiliicoccus intestinalis TaxID=1406512 RepID=R9TAU2_METII|nr:basic membrane lipoprotein [Candidatus Methanomassiliicoccus intestinalis Issoire-Mx1]TQS83770.1 MAG: hypothetical protein A3206_02790 [Candidatus Methanomassiliicoccus intestinalis]